MPCWAESLGDCSDKLTREHLISEGMYPDQTLRVKGLSWCKDEFKEIPITNLVKKVLCRHHNGTISYVDQVGANTINAFREASRVREERAQMGPRRWRIERVQIDGYGLERWCLKTLVNFAAEGAHKIGRDSSSDGQPSPRISRIIFGHERFKPRAGLYGIASVGANWHTGVDGIRLVPYVDSDGVMVGGLFGIHGFQFMLYLEEQGLAHSIQIPDLDGDMRPRLAQTLYPIRKLIFNLGEHTSHIFEFSY
jgi:hypothetical protein